MLDTSRYIIVEITKFRQLCGLEIQNFHIFLRIVYLIWP